MIDSSPTSIGLTKKFIAWRRLTEQASSPAELDSFISARTYRVKFFRYWPLSEHVIPASRLKWHYCLVEIVAFIDHFLADELVLDDWYLAIFRPVPVAYGYRSMKRFGRKIVTMSTSVKRQLLKGVSLLKPVRVELSCKHKQGVHSW